MANPDFKVAFVAEDATPRPDFRVAEVAADAVPAPDFIFAEAAVGESPNFRVAKVTTGARADYRYALASGSTSALAFPAQGAAYDFNWTFLIDPVAPYRTIAPNTGVQPIGSNTNPLLYKQMTTQVSHYIEDTDGSLLLRDGNMGPRRSRKGLLSYNGQWNRTVAPRDLTNAAWVKANATAALNQIGREGSANTASLLTFTADNGTVTQAITNASILRRLYFDVKRVSGTDPLEFSFDNGVTWYSITPTGTGWNRAKSSLQTVTDPTIILRGKNSNSFVLDFINLMEPREGPQLHDRHHARLRD